jgi:hypothetical protein
MLKAENSSLEKQLQRQLATAALDSSMQQRSTTSLKTAANNIVGYRHQLHMKLLYNGSLQLQFTTSCNSNSPLQQ